MMNWLRKLFGCKPPTPPEPVEVGKALITVETEVRTYQSEKTGSYCIGFGEVLVRPAASEVRDWLDVCGQRNMWSVGGGEHIPTHLIKRIVVKYEKFKVQRP